jgi:chemosensory pili system protein ChpA (sensor histidine kinase/response regulator)
MANGRDKFALDWTKGELLETLNDAREALEAFVESDRDETRMRACLTSLHQVHGTLVMLELTGVTLLADHLEQLAQRMLAGEVDDESSASQVLMQGILELPGYFDEIQAGEPDTIKAVAPLVNEVRGQLGEASIGLDGEIAAIARPAPQPALARFESIDGSGKTRKIRAAYQQVLLSILKGQDVDGSVDMLHKVAQGLQRVCEGTPHEQQWQAFGEFVASLRNHQGPLEGDSIKLLRRVDSEIRILGQDGVSILKRPVSSDLVAQLLDEAAARGHRSEILGELRSAIQGREVAPQTINPTGRQALSSAALALREELLLVKDQLDLIVRAPVPSTDQLGNLVAPLRQIGSTLSLLGFENSREIVADQIEALGRAAGSMTLDQAEVMSIAGALVQVDENLASFSAAGKDEAERIVDEAQKQVTVEARQGLEQVKQDVVDFISASWDPRHLEETPRRIAAICGALNMIPLSRAATLLAGCGRYVLEKLATGPTPDWQEMDQFADAVSGLDYYLERIGDETDYGIADVLDLVERSLNDLGIDPHQAPIPAAIQEVAEAEHAVETDALEAEATLEVEPATDVPEAEAEAETAAEEIVATSEIEPVGAVLDQALTGAAEDEESEPALALEEDPDFDLSDSSFDLLDETLDTVKPVSGSAPPEEPVELEAEAAEEPATAISDVLGADAVATPELPEAEPEPEWQPEPLAAAARTTPVVDPSLADTFDTDPEIVEIFVEEVDEVLETIDTWLPDWQAELLHEESLGEIRRAFHTLKGSGRIVGANVIGELAWSVENMLNRLIDATVEATPAFVTVVKRARSLVPELKDAYEAQTGPDMGRVAFVMDQADTLAAGGVLEELAAAAPEAEQAQPAAEAPAAETPGAELPEREAVEPDLVEADAVEWTPEEELEELVPALNARRESLEIFVGEARTHLAVLAAGMTDDGISLGEEQLRALHTLSGSAAMAEFVSIEKLARPTYALATELRGINDAFVDGEFADYFRRAFDALSVAVEALDADLPVAEHPELIAEADRLMAAVGEAAETTRGRAALMALDGLAVVVTADEYLDRWHMQGSDAAAAGRLVDALTEIRNTALEHAAEPIAELAHAFNGAMIRLQDRPLSDAAHRALTEGHERLLNLFDAVAADQALSAQDDVVVMLDAIGYDEPEAIDEDEAADDKVVAFPADGRLESERIDLEDLEDALLEEVAAPLAGGDADLEVAQAPVAVEAETEEVAGLEIAASAMPAIVADLLPEEVDEEIIEVFFEEADEILESLEENIHQWSSEPENRIYLEHMLRGLHTLKGGARLSGLTRLGDATHQFESFLIDVQNDSDQQVTGFFDDLHGRYDEVTSLLSVIRKALAGEAVDAAALGGEPALVAELGGPSQPPVAEPPEPEATPEQEPEPVRESPFARVEQPKPAAVEEIPVDTRPSQEMVRVGSGLLEELVNLAGESSIVRARVEQGMSDFTNALEEMETTIERLREQLRRLEIETEAQILFRQDRPEGPAYTNFDPLEMDRYSQLQQLSRGLSESASDMLDLKETLLFKARESESVHRAPGLR